jgi:DNA-binding CsgD family transcriptional regulator
MGDPGPVDTPRFNNESAMPIQKTADAALAAGRLAYERHAWGEAFERLSNADAEDGLALEDLKRLGIAAWLSGRPEESLAIGARAHLEAVRDGEVEFAISTAISLGMALMQRNEMAQASGWLARAARLVEETGYDGFERGRLLVPDGMRSLLSGDPVTAFATFEQVATIADRFGDRDLAALGRIGRGQSLIAMDDVRRGVSLLDEAMTAVVAGEVSPIESGIVYCTVIEACHQLYDLRRAQEWTSALTRWLDSQPELVPFRGNCLNYRAELMRLHGAWQDASAEAERAREWLSRPPPEPAVGEAIYQLAELDRLRGAFESAEIGYREAGSWGRLPEPGHALLRLAQGDLRAAATAIRRAQAEAVDDVARSPLLEPAVEIALATGDLVTARESADRLAAMAAQADAPLLRAMALRANGAVRLAEGDVEGALSVLRRAWEVWSALDAPYDAARVRVLTAAACRTLGDADGAAREADAARDVFVRLGASPDLARLDAGAATVGGAGAAAAPGGLSAREVEVLRLVAAGQTNRAIADALTISERTVDRHVSNIFAKLDVSTRAAATAFAYEHGLV